MSRLKKSIIPILIAICICFSSVCSFSIETHAVGDAVYLNYPEPATSDSQGYLVVGINNDGESQVVTFAWSLSSENLTQNTIEKLPFNINIGSNSISFSVTMDTSDNIWTNGYLSYYNYAGRYRILKSFSVAESNEMNFTYTFSEGVTVKSFYVKGAVGNVNVSSSYVSPPTVVFSGGTYGPDIITFLDSFYFYLMETEANTNSIDTFISNYFPDIDSNLSSIKTHTGNMQMYMGSYFPILRDKLQQIDDTLVDIIEPVLNRAEVHLGNIQVYLESYLPSINTYLHNIASSSASDKNAADDYNEKSEEQSSAINQGVTESETEKVDVNSASGTIDSNLNFNAVNEYSNVLVVITNNSTVVTMLLIVMCVALISYVLFGKR